MSTILEDIDFEALSNRDFESLEHLTNWDFDKTYAFLKKEGMECVFDDWNKQAFLFYRKIVCDGIRDNCKWFEFGIGGEKMSSGTNFAIPGELRVRARTTIRLMEEARKNKIEYLAVRTDWDKTGSGRFAKKDNTESDWINFSVFCEKRSERAMWSHSLCDAIRRSAPYMNMCGNYGVQAQVKDEAFFNGKFHLKRRATK